LPPAIPKTFAMPRQLILGCKK